MLKKIIILLMIITNSMPIVACSNEVSAKDIKTIKKADILDFDIKKLNEQEVLKSMEEDNLEYKPTHLIKVTNTSQYRIFKGTVESNFVNDMGLHEKVEVMYDSLFPNQSIYLFAQSTVDNFEITSYYYRTQDISMNVLLDIGKINNMESDTYYTKDYNDKNKIEIELINRNDNSDVDWSLYDTLDVARIKNLTDKEQWVHYDIYLYDKKGDIITTKELNVIIQPGEELYEELDLETFKERFVGEVASYKIVNYSYKDIVDDSGQEMLITVDLIDEIYEMYEN